jgi:hypothetical protein
MPLVEANVWDPGTDRDLEGARTVHTDPWGGCASTDHGVHCWGYSSEGFLLWFVNIRVAPTRKIVGTDHIRELDTADLIRCAVMADGTLQCWGHAGTSPERSIGMLGDDREWLSDVPATVAGIDAVKHVSLGHDHVCATRDDDALWCWGPSLPGDWSESPGSVTPRRVPIVPPS